MPKNQLFKITPDSYIVNALLAAFGLESLEDSRYFTKNNMYESDTLERVIELQDELREYYLPCKARIYLESLTDKKCVTILRQFIKPFHYKCMGLEKSLKGHKQMTYRLLPMDKEQVSPTANTAREYVIDFSV